MFVLFVLAAVGIACSGKSSQSPADSHTPDDVVTAVRGPSWLAHLGLQVADTQMGQMGGSNPAPEPEGREPRVNGGPTTGVPQPGPSTQPGRGAGEGMGPGGGMGTGGERTMGGIMRRFLSQYRSGDREKTSAILHESFQLTGADLYRLNCQSCHGPNGNGAPPEINSLIGPVRATSPDAIEAQVRARGRSIPQSMAVTLAAQADSTLRDRLAKGGVKMPPFTHLRGDEVTALLAHLKVLAGLLPENSEQIVPQSAARVGEHLVKGTCHICHDAVGPGSHTAMMRGIIPSLASMPRNTSLGAVLRQVRDGSSGMMMMMGGQRMPAYPYVTEPEIAAAYFYLEQYRPLP